MPVYAYKGVGAGNRSVRGLIDADSPRTARARLRSEGIFPTEIAEGEARSPISDALSRLRLPVLVRVPALDLALFTRQLATMIAAGVPLVESLAALTQQVENRRLKAVVGRVRETVNHGQTLADALAEHPHVFNDLYCSMVLAGESAGALELVLRRLADYIESQLELRNKMTSAMVYPALMITVSLVVAGVLLVWVVPTITGLLRDLDRPLPLTTVIVIAASDFLVRWWAALLVAFAAAGLVLNRAVATERGRRVWDGLRLRIPVAGRVVRLVSVSRFARTLSTLLTGGVNLVRALDLARNVAGNAVIGEAVAQARDAITRGASIAAPLRQSGEFPPMVTHMIAVGEASGELEDMLGKVADTYDELVENSLNRLTALMGPVLLLFVAGLVVLIILSTLLPLLNLTAAL
jgi:general secretion pathway protein F